MALTGDGEELPGDMLRSTTCNQLRQAKVGVVFTARREHEPRGSLSCSDATKPAPKSGLRAMLADAIPKKPGDLAMADHTRYESPEPSYGVVIVGASLKPGRADLWGSALGSRQGNLEQVAGEVSLTG